MCLKHSVSAYTTMRWSLVYAEQLHKHMRSHYIPFSKKVQKIIKEYLPQNQIKQYFSLVGHKKCVALRTTDYYCHMPSQTQPFLYCNSDDLLLIKDGNIHVHLYWVWAVATELFTRISTGHSMPFDQDTTQNTLMQRRESMVCRNHAHDIKWNRVRHREWREMGIEM